MAISFLASGTSTGASTSPIAPDYPAGTAAGDYIICTAAIKYSTCGISTPSGFEYLADGQGGLGSDGSDMQGTVRVYAFGRVADGSESGTFNVARSGGTLSVMWARTATFRNATGLWDVVGGTTAADNSAGTSVSFTYDIDPGFVADDWGVTCWAVNTSAYTVSTHAMSAAGLSGITSASPLSDAVVIGTKLRAGLTRHAIGSGTSSGVATYTHTASGNNSVAPTGGSVLIRLREIPASGTALPIFMHNYRQRRSA